MANEIQQYIDEATKAIDQEKYLEAADFADKALKIEPKNVQALILRAIIYSQLDQPTEANKIFEKAIKLDPNNQKAYYNYAAHLYQITNLNKALKMANVAHELNTDHKATNELLELIHGELPFARPYTEQKKVKPPKTVEKTIVPTIKKREIQPNQITAYELQFPKWIQRLGKKWISIAWVLTLLSFLNFVVVYSFVISKFSEANIPVKNLPVSDVQQKMLVFLKQLIEQNQNFFILTGTIGLLASVVTLAWVTTDIIYRRANLFWFIPFILLFYWGCVWLLLPAYLLTAVRNSKNKL